MRASAKFSAKYPRYIIRGPLPPPWLQQNARVPEIPFSLLSADELSLLSAARAHTAEDIDVEISSATNDERRYLILMELAIKKYLQYQPRREAYPPPHITLKKLQSLKRRTDRLAKSLADLDHEGSKRVWLHLGYKGTGKKRASERTKEFLAKFQLAIAASIVRTKPPKKGSKIHESRRFLGNDIANCLRSALNIEFSYSDSKKLSKKSDPRPRMIFAAALAVVGEKLSKNAMRGLIKTVIKDQKNETPRRSKKDEESEKERGKE